MRGYPAHLHEVINEDLQESIYDETLEELEDSVPAKPKSIKTNERIFKSENGLELIVRHRKSAVILEVSEAPKGVYKFSFEFTTETFKELLDYIELISMQAWSNLTPKEAGSMGADYFEYYDRKLDNNGYLSIKKNVLRIERPSEESNRLYQFNKLKMESFIYDFRKL